MAKSMQAVTLYGLAFAGYVYRSMTGFDESLRRLWEASDGHVDLAQASHRSALIQWLRDWGCRQFAVEHEQAASDNISDWFQANQDLLPSVATPLWAATRHDFDAATKLYRSLFRTAASTRVRKGVSMSITVGPTGASKILFALRPNFFIPWDIPMRAAFGRGDDEKGYQAYLRHVASQLEGVGQECLVRGFDLKHMPTAIGSPGSTPTKLVDEFYWVTVTRQCQVPSVGLLKKWVGWADGNGSPKDAQSPGRVIDG